ncbi:ammonium transporter [Candidatus Bathyarchaeota archaeon]|nr:ammonium transporter [Candidatus Bathyarchaeota archaeon]
MCIALPRLTPTGFVPVWAAIPFGVLGAACSNYATKLKFLLRVDDALDIFAVHAVGGLVGTVLTGIFASRSIAALGGARGDIEGGWLDGHWAQLGYQLAGSCAGGAYSFAVTCALLALMNLVPGLGLRVSEEAEVLGVDDAEVGEFAYDYVELTREVLVGVDEGASRYSADGGTLHSMEKLGAPLVDPRLYGHGASPGAS